MSRRLISTALAIMLAGGVYLSAGTAEASNMGFKLERSFAWQAGAKNLYFVSFPLFNGLGDISDGTGCSGTDGLINANDALCDFTTDRDTQTSGGLMTIQHLNEMTCSYEGRSIIKTPTGLQFIGAFQSELTTPENREVGYYINVGKNVPTDPDPENRSVIVGSHDPSWAGKMIQRRCPLTVLNLPYHTMYRTANEILCGLEGVDWVDADSDGNPDTCGDAGSPGGLYDPVSGLSVTTQTIVPGPGGGFQGRSAFKAGSVVRFIGTNFDLTPGDAYLFNMPTGYNDRLWGPPHF
jgi:hypothetical protein